MPSWASTWRLSGALAPGPCIGPLSGRRTTPARTRTVPTRVTLRTARSTGRIQDDFTSLAATAVIAFPPSKPFGGGTGLPGGVERRPAAPLTSDYGMLFRRASNWSKYARPELNPFAPFVALRPSTVRSIRALTPVFTPVAVITVPPAVAVPSTRGGVTVEVATPLPVSMARPVMPAGAAGKVTPPTAAAPVHAAPEPTNVPKESAKIGST